MTEPDLPYKVYEDTDHLCDLLSLLPDPGDEENRDWWGEFAACESARHTGRRTPDPGYIIKKLAGYREVSSPWELRSLATYCLMFFEGASPEMIDLVGRQIGAEYSGARFIESVCQTAWRIYVPTEAKINRADVEEDTTDVGRRRFSILKNDTAGVDHENGDSSGDQ